MSTTWREDDEDFKMGGGRGGLKAKPRFSFTEVKLLLEAVKRNRYIILRKFNQGVSAETKKQTWTEITNQINGLGENHREVRQIMKKWADLKCDGKRRIAALRGPDGNTLRKKRLGPVERMVHKILMMSPRGDGDSDLDLGEEEDLSGLYSKGSSSNPSAYSYLSLTDSSHVQGEASFDISPLSSPEKELGGDPFHSSSDFDQAEDGEQNMDFDETDDSMFSSYPPSAPPPSSTSLDPLPDDALMRVKPVHTYSRNNSQNPAPNQNSSSSSSTSKPPPGPSSSSSVPSDSAPSSAAAPPPPSQSPTSSNTSVPPPAGSSTSAGVATSDPSSTSIPPPPASSAAAASPTSTAAASNTTSPPSTSTPADPLPAGASSRRSQDQVAQLASQSLQQQRASRMLLTSVSRSLEVLAQSIQLLVESQQEFVQESLLLQRETVDILRDFSNTALTMLRDKANGGHLVTHRPPHF